MEKQLPVFSGKVPRLSGGDLGNPTETGWRRMGFLCEKGWLLFAVKTPVAFFLKMKDTHCRPGHGASF